MYLKIFSLIVILSALGFTFPSEKNDTVLSFGNSHFQKSFAAETEEAGPIKVHVLDPKQIQINNPDHPFFEFVINNKVVKSSDEIWQFLDYSKRAMKNGGSEYSLNFVASDGPITGLGVKIIQQTFPESTLVREKIILSSSDKVVYKLNKLDGKCHFHFPKYQIKSEDTEASSTSEIKLASWDLKPTTFGESAKGNHMYYPDISESNLNENEHTYKGPVVISSDGIISWFTAYEHASQDNTNGMFDKSKKESKFIVDAMQGTKGVFNFPLSDEDFMFLGVKTQRSGENFNVDIAALRGAYYEGESISKSKPYESVWTATAFYEGQDIEIGKSILRNYILNEICEEPASREIEFYYNTWGLQRNDKSKELRGILSYERIFEEIDYAADLGIDIFVLDDGWEEAQGDWTPHKERLHLGLAPIKQKLDSLGIKMGLWLSPMGIDSTTQRYKDHPEWVIKDSENNPILAQWGHPAFDFVGEFYDLFIEDCKKLIDQGCLFMKWDAINTFYSSLPNLGHGDASISAAERRARYEYLLPIYVTKAMEELTEYEPELVIEIDITEARRVMIGLAPLSQGKFFWMNNGASGYNDYSTYRSQSMRTIINEYASLIPREVLTYANYPHNQEGALEYNTINSILAGNGFWGNLSLMNEEELSEVGRLVSQSKDIQGELYGIPPKVYGQVGDSPETYIFYNEKNGIGQVISFSTEESSDNLNMDIKRDLTLGVINAPFTISEDELKIKMEYEQKNSSKFLPIVPNDGLDANFSSSTTPLTALRVVENGLEYTVSQKGQQIILWGKALGEPEISSNKAVISSVREVENSEYYKVQINNSTQKQTVTLEKL